MPVIKSVRSVIGLTGFGGHSASSRLLWVFPDVLQEGSANDTVCFGEASAEKMTRRCPSSEHWHCESCDGPVFTPKSRFPGVPWLTPALPFRIRRETWPDSGPRVEGGVEGVQEEGAAQ